MSTESSEFGDVVPLEVQSESLMDASIVDSGEHSGVRIVGDEFFGTDKYGDPLVIEDVDVNDEFPDVAPIDRPGSAAKFLLDGVSRGDFSMNSIVSWLRSRMVGTCVAEESGVIAEEEDDDLPVAQGPVQKVGGIEPMVRQRRPDEHLLRMLERTGAAIIDGRIVREPEKFKRDVARGLKKVRQQAADLGLPIRMPWEK